MIFMEVYRTGVFSKTKLSFNILYNDALVLNDSYGGF